MADQQDRQPAVRVLGERPAPRPAPVADEHDVRVMRGSSVVPKPPTVTLILQAEVEVDSDRLAAGQTLTREQASAYVERAHPAVSRLAAQLVQDDPSARVRVTVGPYVVNKRGSWSS